MATTMSDDRGMLVHVTDGDYYYLADSLGQPVSDGWRDREKAVAAFEAADESGWPPAEIDLDEYGEIKGFAGHVHVWGGDLEEVQFCHVDRYGTFDAGPETEDQAEIEEQIQEGWREGETAGGYKWRYTSD